MYSGQNSEDGALDASRSGNHRERTGRREDVRVGEGVGVRMKSPCPSGNCPSSNARHARLETLQSWHDQADFGTREIL
jgi:hypothetical protein